MRKFILIPIIYLGYPAKVQFLEIMSEAGAFGSVNFQALKTSGLTSAITITEQILNSLSHPSISANNLYLSYHLLNLNELRAISLGLTLAAFMQQKNCNYQKIIAMGEIDPNCPQLSISAGQYFETQIEAVLSLGQQKQTVAFFIPAQLFNETLKQRLALLNIQLKAVATLSEALIALGVRQKT